MGYSLTQALLALFVGMFALKSFDLPWSEGRKAIAVWSHRALGHPARQPV